MLPLFHKVYFKKNEIKATESSSVTFFEDATDRLFSKKPFSASFINLVFRKIKN